jgi:hypothetical protein
VANTGFDFAEKVGFSCVRIVVLYRIVPNRDGRWLSNRSRARLCSWRWASSFETASARHSRPM